MHIGDTIPTPKRLHANSGSLAKSFFQAAAGHAPESIHAAAILALLEARHGIRLCSQDLAGRPTIAAIAAYIDETATVAVAAAAGGGKSARRRFGG